MTDASSQKLFVQREWFLIYDSIPPLIANVRVVLLANHTLAVQALAGDEHSGLHEGRGLVLYYSVDGGQTWVTEAPSNRIGHFVEPTVFEFNPGPFKPGTKLIARLEATDRAGNTESLMRDDVGVFVAPANAERLVTSKRSESPPERSRIFAIEWLQGLHDALTAHQDALNAMEQSGSKAVAGADAGAAYSPRQQMVGSRIKDLQWEFQELSAFGIDVAGFRRIEASGVKAAGRGYSTLTLTIP